METRPRASRRRVQSPSPPHVFTSFSHAHPTKTYAEVAATAALMMDHRSVVSPDEMRQFVKSEVREVRHHFQQLLLVFLVFLLLLALGAFFLRERSSL